MIGGRYTARAAWMLLMCALLTAVGASPVAAASTGGGFHGQVLDEERRPASDVVITVWTRTAADGWESTASATTDRDGRYQVPATDGDHRLMFQRGNFVQYAPEVLTMVEATVYPLAAGAQIVVDEQLLFPARLVGSLHDIEGAAVPDIVVELRKRDLIKAHTRTGNDGHFDFGPMSPGVFSLAFVLPDGRRQYWPSTLDPASAEPIELVIGHGLTVEEVMVPAAG